MKAAPPNIQIYGITILAVIALGTAFQSTRNAFKASEDRVFSFVPKVQVDVLQQEAAETGKEIHVSDNGQEILNYKCRPTDAAIAVLSVRSKDTGEAIAPHFVSATDPEGHQYLASIRSTGKVSLLSLQTGFGVRPSSVSVKLLMGPINSAEAQSTITLTKIAEPHRLLSPPVGKLAEDAAKIAIATFHHDLKTLKVESTEQLPPNQAILPKLLETSYGAGLRLRAGQPYVSMMFPADSGKDLDAVKVQLDRVEYSEHETELIYKNAVVKTQDGVRYIEFPDRERIGAFPGYEAWVSSSRPPPGRGLLVKNTGNRGTISIRARPIISAKKKRESGFSAPPIFNLVSVSPRPETMGFGSVRVELFGPMANGSFSNGFIDAITADGPLNTKTPQNIPELKVVIRVRTPKLVSSRTVVLPVKHAMN